MTTSDDCRSYSPTTTLPPGGSEFLLGPDICGLGASLAGQTGCGYFTFECVCSVSGHVIPNYVFYAYPGDSVSISVFHVQPAVRRLPSQPQQQYSVVPGRAVVSARKPLLPTRGSNSSTRARRSRSRHSGPKRAAQLVLASTCFEFVLGSSGEQDCAQMDGNPVANYCSVYGKRFSHSSRHP